ncbi:hypothetical protein, partial [Stenotrophomonas sp. PSU_St142]
PTKMPPARAAFSFRVRPVSGRCRPWSAPLGEAANGNAIGVPSKLGTYKNAACKGGIFVPGAPGFR